MEPARRDGRLDPLEQRGLPRPRQFVDLPIGFPLLRNDPESDEPLDQFWWFLGSGLALGVVFLTTRRLLPGIIIHWLVILSALFGIFSAVTASG
jgi:hypothetical protein